MDGKASALARALQAVPAEAVKSALIDAVNKLKVDEEAMAAFASRTPAAGGAAPSRTTPIAAAGEAESHAVGEGGKGDAVGLQLSPGEKKSRQDKDAASDAGLTRAVNDVDSAAADVGVSVAGIGISTMALRLHEELLKRKLHKWVMFSISRDMVSPCFVGERGSTYEDFVNLLPANECRFGVVDIDLVNSDGCQMSRIVFVNWAPDAAAMMLKMKSASTKQHFKNSLQGVTVELQATDRDELGEEGLMARIRDSMTRR